MVLTFLVPIHSSGEDGCVNRRFRLLIGLIDENVYYRGRPLVSVVNCAWDTPGGKPRWDRWWIIMMKLAWSVSFRSRICSQMKLRSMVTIGLKCGLPLSWDSLFVWQVWFLDFISVRTSSTFATSSIRFNCSHGYCWLHRRHGAVSVVRNNGC